MQIRKLSTFSPEKFSGFRTELQPLMKYIKYSDDQYALMKMMNTDAAFHHMEARLVDIINRVTGSKIPYNKKQEEINVCKAIEDMIHDAVQQKDTELQRKQTEIQQKQTELQQKQTELQRKQTELQRKQTEIQNLQEQNAALKKKMDLLMQSLSPEQLQILE